MRLGIIIILIVVPALLLPSKVDAQECHPQVEGVRFDGEFDADIALRLHALYQADQAIRLETASGDDVDIEQFIRDDRARREEVITYLQAGQITGGTWLFYAAMIFQHGDCPDHYQLASELAFRAVESGNIDARWLHAAATDRYLLSVGEFQHYGTQYVADALGQFALCPVADITTDAERAEWGLSSLEKLRARASEFDGMYNLEPHPLATVAGVPFLGYFVNQFVIYSNCFSH